MTNHCTTTGDVAPLSGEAKLWRAAFLQALHDAQLPRHCRERTEARMWLAMPDADFDFVVESAGYDPTSIREGLHSLITAWDDEQAMHVDDQRALKKIVEHRQH
jgi:hypothetical protein